MSMLGSELPASTCFAVPASNECFSIVRDYMVRHLFAQRMLGKQARKEEERMPIFSIL
jgi:hypothetical protein